MSTLGSVLCRILAAVAVFCLCGKALAGEDIRRIALDGREGVAAPPQETGKDGIARIQKVPEPALELYPAAAPSRGTVLLCPGGGYSILAVVHEGRDIAKMLNDCGYDVALLLYRVKEGDNTRAMALEDAKNALKLIRTRGASFGISATRIGAMGFSAGGHLAARLAHEAAAEGAPLHFLVLMYPAYLEKDGKVLDEVAPSMVRTFVYVAADDRYAPSSRAFVAACKEQNIDCEFHQPEAGGHGFGLKSKLPPAVRDWPEMLKSFLQK